MAIKFGTDGWRAVISEDFTFENVRIVAQAVADYFNSCNRTPKMVVGYDWRFMSEKYAEIITEVLAGNGIEVILSDRAVPTPLVSLAIKKKNLSGGIMITASHNPPYYNGIKIKAPFAGSADPEMTKQIESLLGKNPVKHLFLKAAIDSKKVKLLDLSQDYLKFVKNYIDLKLLKRKRFKVLVDCMHGTGAGYIKQILKGTGLQITEIRTERDAYFGNVNPEPIPQNLEATKEALKEKKFDIAIINDGDADRIGAMTSSGRYISAGQIMALLLLHFVEDRKWSGGVVKTISNTTLIELIAKKYNLKLYETPVGFKYVCSLMLKKDILIGGEESGGIGVKNYIPERDGMLLGILLLEMMGCRNKTMDRIIKDVEKEYGRFYYDRIDMDYSEEKRVKLMELLKNNPPKELLGSKIKEIKTDDGVKLIAEDNSWLILRPSGTEPIIRIYAEASSEKRVNSYLELGKKIALSV